MSIVGEVVVEAVNAAVETAAGSRSRKVRWVAYGALFVIVALIVAVLIIGLSE